MTPRGVEACSVPSSTASARYETLRMAALGEPLPPEARSGLMLFFSRGLWGWARTLAAPSIHNEPISAPSSNRTAPCERNAVVHILAALAITTPDRRVL